MGNTCSCCCSQRRRLPSILEERRPLLSSPSPSLIDARLNNEADQLSFSQTHLQFQPLAMSGTFTTITANANFDPPKTISEVPSSANMPAPITQSVKALPTGRLRSRKSHARQFSLPNENKKRRLTPSVAQALPALDSLIQLREEKRKSIRLKHLSGSSFLTSLEAYLISTTNGDVPTCLQSASEILLVANRAGSLQFSETFIKPEMPPLAICRDIITTLILDQSFKALNEWSFDRVANSMRAFCRVLEDPVITNRNYFPLLGMTNITDESALLCSLHSIMFSIPKPMRDTLSFLAGFVAELATDSHRLDILCQYFGPYIVRPVDPPVEQAEVVASLLATNPSKQPSMSDIISNYSVAISAWKLIVQHRNTIFALNLPYATFEYDRGRLLCEAASVEFWVELLLDEYYDDPTFLGFTFSAIDSFLAGAVVLEKLMVRYRKCIPEAGAPIGTQHWMYQRRLRILFIIKNWISARQDFSKDVHMLASLQVFMDVLPVPKNPEFMEKQLFNSINSLILDLNNPVPSSKRLHKLIHNPPLNESTNLLSLPPELVAETITIIDSDTFALITSSDCYSKPSRHEHTAIGQMANHFNVWSLCLQSSILSSKDAPQRSEKLATCFKIIVRLLELQNYSGAYAVYCCLTSLSIERLSETWNLLGNTWSQFKQHLDSLFSFDQNFRRYREVLTRSELPLVPITAIISRQFAGIDESMPAQIEDLINVDKLRSIYYLDQEIKQYQKSSYAILPLHVELKELLSNLKPDRFNEDDLHSLSVALEPKRKQ